MTTKVPDFMVERLARGELGPEAAAEVRAALGEDADARLAALAEDDASILAELPPAEVADEVRRRIARARPRPEPTPVRWWVPTAALVAAGAIAWFALRPAPPGPPGTMDGGSVERIDGDEIRTKGDPQLAIDRLGGVGAQRLKDGDEVAAGDRLQVQYRAAGRTHGAIVSIDGAGATTLHFPASRDGSPRLEPGGLIALDHSYELDDAPGFERFFFVTVAGSSAFEVDTVVQAAERLASGADARDGALVLPAGYEQRSLGLRKRPR